MSRTSRCSFVKSVETKPTSWYSNQCHKNKTFRGVNDAKVVLTAAITGAGDTIQKMRTYQLHHKNLQIQQLNVHEQEQLSHIFM